MGRARGSRNGSDGLNGGGEYERTMRRRGPVIRRFEGRMIGDGDDSIGDTLRDDGASSHGERDPDLLGGDNGAGDKDCVQDVHDVERDLDSEWRGMYHDAIMPSPRGRGRCVCDRDLDRDLERDRDRERDLDFITGDGEPDLEVDRDRDRERDLERDLDFLTGDGEEPDLEADREELRSDCDELIGDGEREYPKGGREAAATKSARSSMEEDIIVGYAIYIFQHE